MSNTPQYEQLPFQGKFDLKEAEIRLSGAGYPVSREVASPSGELLGLYFGCPAMHLQSAEHKVKTILDGLKLKVWCNPNTEQVHIEEPLSHHRV
jgi:hypothetical protein